MLNIIYNPTAGKGLSQRALAAVKPKLEALGRPFSVFTTTAVGEAKTIASNLSGDIIVMGGDGTINEVLNGLKDPSSVRLGLIPCGSGNDFASMIGMPSDPLKALDLILTETAKPTDYLECSGIRGLNVIGTGIDVDILRRCYKARFLKGSANYFVSLLITLLRYRNIRTTTELNGKRESHDALILCACNGRRFGGGIPICPIAQVDDGKLDTVIVKDVRRSMIPKALLKLMKGKLLDQPIAHHDLSDRFVATFDTPTTIQIDGELYDNLPFDVRVVPHGINIYRK